MKGMNNLIFMLVRVRFLRILDFIFVSLLKILPIFTTTFPSGSKMKKAEIV